MINIIYSKCIVGVVFVLMTNCEYDLKQQQEQNKKFIILVNKIPSLDIYPATFSDDEISNYLYCIEHKPSYAFCNDKKIGKNISELRCAYSLIFLQMLYHLQFMVLFNQINEPTIELYREYVHRMLSVLIFVKARVPLSIWFVSISLDAVIGKQLSINELNIGHFSYLNYDYCLLCQRRSNLQHINVPTDYSEEGLISCVHHIEFAINDLKLTIDSEVNELFVYENSANMYEFIWKEDHDYRKIIPPRRLFPFYNDSIVELRYITAKNSWSKDYFIILTYADVIKENALLVIYYSIVRHLYYIRKMWFIIFEWYTCFDSESENYRILKDSRKELLETPLSAFKEMVSYVAHENFYHVRDIITFLSSHEDVTKERLDDMFNSTLRQYSYYARIYGLEEESVESTMRQIVDVPNTCNLEVIKEDLQKIRDDMYEYFKEFQETTSPLYWPILHMFSTSKKNNPFKT